MDCERPSPLSLVVSVTSWVNLPDLSNISTAAGPEGGRFSSLFSELGAYTGGAQAG